MKKAMAARVAAQASVESSRRPNGEQLNKDSSEAPQMDTTPSIATPNPAPDATPAAAPATTLHSNLNMTDPGSHPRAAWEHVDEILQALKTTFPLLILSLETMVDQVQHKFKPSPEEDVYRSICMLLSDAIQVIECLLFTDIWLIDDVSSLLELCHSHKLAG